MRVEVISVDSAGRPDGWIYHESKEERWDRVRQRAEASKLRLTPGQLATLRRG